MTLFDLVFLLVALASAVTLLVTVGLVLAGRGARAWRLLRAYLAFAAIYMAVVVASPLVVPRRVITLGESLCFDDWCIAIDSVTPSTSSSGTTYDVKFRMFSRARGITQRENNLALYLVDSSGRRFNPLPRESDVPLNVQLGPGDSADARRTFDVPPDAKDLGLVIAHEGGFPIEWFIVAGRAVPEATDPLVARDQLMKAWRPTIGRHARPEQKCQFGCQSLTSGGHRFTMLIRKVSMVGRQGEQTVLETLV